MRLRDVVSRSDMIELARSSETAIGRAYRAVIEAQVAEAMKKLRRKPKVNPVDAKEDVRYLFGLMDGLDCVLSLQEEALSELSKPVSSEEELEEERTSP